MADFEFKDNRINVKNLIDENIEAFLEEAGGEVTSRVKRNTRVDTGQTKGSWFYYVNKSENEVLIGSNLQNSIWEEFGTGEYALGGDGRKGGWYYKDRKGKWHFTKGKTPSRALYKAFTTTKDKIIKRAKKILEG